MTPQVVFKADLAPPHRRASAVSIVLSGLLLGILFARVLAGVIAEFSGSDTPGREGWRNVYWMAFGIQICTWIIMYSVVPDWPAKNHGNKLTYPGILYSMAKFAVTEPLLIQCCLIGVQFSLNISIRV